MPRKEIIQKLFGEEFNANKINGLQAFNKVIYYYKIKYLLI